MTLKVEVSSRNVGTELIVPGNKNVSDAVDTDPCGDKSEYCTWKLKNEDNYHHT